MSEHESATEPTERSGAVARGRATTARGDRSTPAADTHSESKRFDPHAIRGILPTVLTPFDENEQIDDVALRAQVQYLLDAGVHGLVLMGSFGECPYLGDEDREIVIRTCVDCTAGSVPIVVGVTATSTFVAAEQIRAAHRLGANAAMVCLPQYFTLSYDDVLRHFARLSESTPIPLLYYHYPATTGLQLSPAQVAELITLDAMIGIKESTFDMLSIKRHIERTRQLDRVYLSGSELNFVQFMRMGGHGVVGTAALFMPRTAVAMYDAFTAGDHKRAKELQMLLFETMPLAKDVRAPVSMVRPAFLLALRQGLDVPLDTAPTHVRLKAALARRGVPIRPVVRSPLPPLSPRDEQVVSAVMDRIAAIEPNAKP